MMKTVIKLPNCMSTIIEGFKSIIVEIDSESNVHWCLDLCLLENNIIEQVTVISDTSSFKLQISKDSEVTRQERGRITWGLDSARLALSSTELEYWISFFLKYYHVGMGDVDHIDVEVNSINDSKMGYLTLKIPTATPPVSSDEAKRRLGLL